MDTTTCPPQTPPMSSLSHHTFFDSPLSDYHTDSSRSSISHSTSTPAQKDLLRRLSYIGEMIQRHDPKPQLTRAMHLKLDAVEAILSAPDPQSRLHLEDSGLFLDDEELKDEEKEVTQATAGHTRGQVTRTAQDDLELSRTHFDIADQIARNVEEHMDFMNELLDEAKHREQELVEYLAEICDSKRELGQRFEEVKRNNLAAIEHINVLKREVTSLKNVKDLMQARILANENTNSHLLDRVNELEAFQSLGTISPNETSPSETLHLDGSNNAKPSRWSAFWGALGDATGILDYETLLNQGD